jgi:hypothetical protein
MPLQGWCSAVGLLAALHHATAFGPARPLLSAGIKPLLCDLAGQMRHRGHIAHRRAHRSSTSLACSSGGDIARGSYGSSGVRTATGVDTMSALPAEVAEFQRAIAAVRQLPRVRNNSSSSAISNMNNLHQVCREGKPTYRRLFTHRTWEAHLGGSTLRYAYQKRPVKEIYMT